MKKLLLIILFFNSIAAIADVRKHAALYPSMVEYDVFRKGEPIGEYLLKFDTSDEGLTVAIEMDLTIKFLGLFDYSYGYKAKEWWGGSQIKNMQIELNKNGEIKHREWLLENDSLVLIEDNKPKAEFDKGLLPTHHWLPSLLESPKAINTLKAKEINLKPELEEEFSLSVSGEVLPVKAYRLGGELQHTQSWYDKNGVWRGMRFKARDGSDIEVVWRGAKRVEVSG